MEYWNDGIMEYQNKRLEDWNDGMPKQKTGKME